MSLSDLITVDGAAIDYSGLPQNHRESFRLYIEHGYHPGSGISAILQNDLRACIMVDAETFQQLPKIYRWVVNHAPSLCWGSEERVMQWGTTIRRLREQERNSQVAEPLRGIVNSISEPRRG